MIPSHSTRRRVAASVDGDPVLTLRAWGKAYRDHPEHRFPSDPNAEFFPVDLEQAAAKIEQMRSEYRRARDSLDEITMERNRLRAENARLTSWLECIERITDEEIGVRFRTSSHKSEEQVTGKSQVYAMLVIPRNLARKALAGDSYEQSTSKTEVK